MGRRVKKTVSTYSAGAWTETSNKLFVYDGWNLIQELDGSTGNALKSYIWGLDLSQSLQGAGGVGGLLASYDYATSSTNYFCFDGNGNVGQMIDSSDGSVKAHYEYDPFGNQVFSYGDSAGDNPFRFSTKYFDDETGLVSYIFRYYSPELGRWMNRDPIGEKGFLKYSQTVPKSDIDINLYLFTHNNPVNFYDILGLVKWYPNEDTGKDRRPWGEDDESLGDDLIAKTDAGNPIPIWRPHDGTTFWCHGYTFDGHLAQGGPYSISGKVVPRVLDDDGWKPVCCGMADSSDIVVFFKHNTKTRKIDVPHSGKILSIIIVGATFDEKKSMISSKWGKKPIGPKSFEKNALKYGKYSCYTKNLSVGACPCKGEHELRY